MGEAETARAAVVLRDVVESDLAAFFEQQLDPEANRMAAFASDDPTDRPGFMALWAGILANPDVVKRTIEVEGRIAGNIVHFQQFGLPAVGYWLGREFWGRGIASAALGAFLEIVTKRPLFARAAIDNFASRRVLTKCGFVRYSQERSWANARRREVDEEILVLHP
jgi:RimJ/RimL family protein N-acetyltransferase